MVKFAFKQIKFTFWHASGYRYLWYSWFVYMDLQENNGVWRFIIITPRLNPGTDFDTVQDTGNYKEPLIASADNCITKSN